MNRIPNTSEAGEIATWMVSLGFEYQAPGTSTASAEWWKTNSKGEFELYCTSEQASFFYAHTKAACERAGLEARLDELLRVGNKDTEDRPLLTRTDTEKNGHTSVITVAERREFLEAQLPRTEEKT